MFISQNFFSEGNKNFFFRKKNLDNTMRRVRRASRLGRAKRQGGDGTGITNRFCESAINVGGFSGGQSYGAGIQETSKRILIQLQAAKGCRR